MGREDAVMISTFVGAIVDLILNAIAIPILGASGAAIGTLVAEFVVLIVQLIYLRKDVAFLYNGQSYLKLLIALIAAFIAGCAVKLLISGIFIKLVISVMLFFGVYALILYILKEEIVTENVNKVIQMIKSHIK